MRTFCRIKGTLVTSVLSFLFYQSFSTNRHQFYVLHVTNPTFLPTKNSNFVWWEVIIKRQPGIKTMKLHFMPIDGDDVRETVD